MVLRQLEYLCALADERHFGRAAESCHVSQPALSIGIRKLESELGLELVRRGRRYDDLTPAGKKVLGWARRAVSSSQAIDAEASRLKGELEGTLRLGIIPTAVPVIAEITGTFLLEHPSVDLEVRSLSAAEIIEGIETFAIDAGVTYLDQTVASGLRASPIFDERYAFLCPAGEASGSSIRWCDLDDASLCLLTAEMQNRRLVDAALAAAGAAPKVRIETDSISGLLSFANQGWSSIVSEAWLGLYGVPEGMEALPIVKPIAVHPIGIVTRDSEHVSPIVGELLRSAHRVG